MSFYDSQRVLTQEEIDAFFGPPLEECYRRLYPEADPGFILNLSRYHNKVGRSSLHLVQLYPKVGETLEKLRSKGIKLGLVTSRDRLSLMEIMDNLGITGYFNAIVAQEDVIEHKPEPEPVKKGLAILGVNPFGACMSGDTVGDILCAKRAGIRTTVGALYGFSRRSVREQLFQAGADYYIERFEEILEIVQPSFLSKPRGLNKTA